MVTFRSVDDGETFGEAGAVWERVPQLWMQGGGVWNLQLSSGRIVVPFMAVAAPIDLQGIETWCFLSDDGGRSWRRSRGNLTLPKRGAMEPCVAELPDGELVMTLRTELGLVYLSRSSDGGDTWSEPVSTGVDNPESPIRIRAVPGGADLLMVTNVRRPYCRTPLNGLISTDRGSTWRIAGNILSGDDEFECGVQDVMFLNDDEVLIVMGWCKPLWNRERCPLFSVVVQAEWFYRT
jgi:sialidase-1